MFENSAHQISARFVCLLVMYVQSVSHDCVASRKSNSVLLMHHTKLLEILEIPQVGVEELSVGVEVLSSLQNFAGERLL